MIALFGLGIWKKLSKNVDFIDLLFGIYLLVLLLYPYGRAGFRFLLPAFPFILLYIFKGFDSLKFNKEKTKSQAGIFISVIILLLYIPKDIKIIQSRQSTKEGPHTENSLEVFEFIRKNTAQDARIAFIRPRVLALFTDRYSMGTKYQDSPAEIKSQYISNGVDYILHFDLLFDENVKNYIHQNNENLELVYKNKKFKLYKIIKY